MSEDLKLSIELNQKQARIIQEALDLYSRLQMGQIKEIDMFFRIRKMKGCEYDHEVAVGTLEQLKRIYFPELSRNGYYGIFGDGTPEEAKIAWDLIQSIRYTVAWKLHPEGGMTTDFGEPIRSSQENLPIITILETT